MQSEEDKSPLVREAKNSWPVEKRLEFIDFRLYWEGRVNRSDLIAFFGISVPQASADLARYQETAPENLVYDKSLKTYVAGPNFQPAFFEPSSDAYLAQLRLMAAGVISQEEALVAIAPEFYVMPNLRRRLSPEILRSVLKSVRGKTSIEVRYQSMSRPEPIWRWIDPHALGFDGIRWHLRAWCHSNNAFRDFLIARILEVRGSKPSIADPSSDTGWNNEVTLKIGPHSGLKGGSRDAIELDYGMESGVVELTTKICLSYYVERALGLDLDSQGRPPERQQIVLLNRDEVEAARNRS